MNNMKIIDIFCLAYNCNGLYVSENSDIDHSILLSEPIPNDNLECYLFNSLKGKAYALTIKGVNGKELIINVSKNSHILEGTDYLVIKGKAFECKYKVIPKVVSKVTKSFNYKLGVNGFKQSNMLYSRIKLGFAKWGSIEKNDISNMSKILEPIFSPFYDSYYKLLKYNYNTKFNIPYKNIRLISQVAPPFAIINNSLGIRLNEASCLESSPVGINIVESKKSYNLTKIFIDKYLPENTETINFSNTVIYVKKIGRNGSEKGFVTIEGILQEGYWGSETVEVIDNLYTQVVSKFKKIVKVVCNFSIVMSNYIDCSVDHFIVKDSKSLPPIVNKSLNSFFPKVFKEFNIDKDRNHLCIYDFKKDLSEVIYTFDLESPEINGCFIDEYLRIFWTGVDNKFYTSTLYHDLSKYVGNDPSANNNDIVKVSNTNTCIGDTVTIDIDTSSIEESSVIIKVSHKDQDLFYNQDKDEFDDQICYTILEDNYLQLSIKVEDSDPYIVKVFSNDFKSCYTAYTHSNIIKPMNTPKDINGSLFIFNGKIVLLNKLLTETNYNVFDEDLYLILNSDNIYAIDWLLDIEGYEIDSNGGYYDETKYSVVSDGSNGEPLVIKFSKNYLLSLGKDGTTNLKLNVRLSPQFSKYNSYFNLHLKDRTGDAFNSIDISPSEDYKTITCQISKDNKGFI